VSFEEREKEGKQNKRKEASSSPPSPSLLPFFPSPYIPLSSFLPFSLTRSNRRLAAKPSISRWDAPPAPSTSSDPKKERDKEKARLKREKEKKEKIEREREKAEVEGGKGRGLMGWVVRKKE